MRCTRVVASRANPEAEESPCAHWSSTAPRGVSVDTVDDPSLQQPTDVILRVTSTAICIRPAIYNGYFQPKPMVLGHERSMGVVESAPA